MNFKKINFSAKIPKNFKCVGIYGIEIDKHLYIGSSKNIYNRITSHKKCLRTSKNENPKFLNAYIKYGIEHAYYYIIETCDSEISLLDLRKREEFWIKELKSDLNVCLTPTTQGKPESSSLRNKQGKKIYQYDLEGNYLREFISASEAGRILNISSSFISQVARNKSAAKSAHGFRWSYIKVTKLPKYVNNSARAKIRKVYLLNTFTGEEYQFDSLADAVRTLNPNSKNFDGDCATLACAANQKSSFFNKIFLAKSKPNEKYKLPSKASILYNKKLNKFYKNYNAACQDLNCTRWKLQFNQDVISTVGHARVKLREFGKLHLLDNPNPSHLETNERIND